MAALDPESEDKLLVHCPACSFSSAGSSVLLVPNNAGDSLVLKVQLSPPGFYRWFPNSISETSPGIAS